MENTLEELTELVKDSNISLLSYSTTKRVWIIRYKSYLTSDEVPTELLIEFLQNV